MNERRLHILKAHPEIRKLMIPDPHAKWVSHVLVGAQVALAAIVPACSFWLQCVLTYVVGATLTQSIFLAMHETCHNNVSTRSWHNRVLAMVLNIPLVFPCSVALRHYHLDHHKHQGQTGLDTDLLTSSEQHWLQRSRYVRWVWITFQLVIYACRPLVVSMHPLPLTPLLIGSVVL